jgi:hypothetical protein
MVQIGPTWWTSLPSVATTAGSHASFRQHQQRFGFSVRVPLTNPLAPIGEQWPPSEGALDL